jgi:hypothetical protein
MNRIRVHELAKELGISSREIVATARDLHFNIIKASAQLTTSQAEAIRRRVAARPPRPLMPPATASLQPPPPRVIRSAECSCCQLLFTYDASRLGFDRGSAVRCGFCEDHYEIKGEDAARRLARFEDHDHRVRRDWQFARQKATEMENRMKHALQSRQKWKAALAEVILAHEQRPNGCSCGAQSYPCLTLRKLEEVNRGIARQVERLGTLSDADLERELYPDRPCVDYAYDDLDDAV